MLLRGQTKGIILLLIIIFGVILVIGPPLTSKPMALLPGAEGAKVGVYSVQNPVTLDTFIVGTDNDPDASIMPDDPYNTRYDPDESKVGYPDVYVTLSKMWSEGETKEPVDYWVHRQDEWVHVKGYVDVLYFHIDFRAEPSGDAEWPYYPFATGHSEYERRWGNTKFWFATGITVWNLAYPDPDESRKEGHVWAAPLSAYVTGAEVAAGSSQYTYIDPEPYPGRQVTLFSGTDGGNIVDIIGNTDPSNLNSTLYTNWGSSSPDTRLRSGIGYFRFTLTDFGCEWWWVNFLWWRQLGYRTPKIEYTLKVYYLVIGQFIYTQDQYEEWILGKAKEEEPKSWLDQLGEWWHGVVTSPYSYIWIAIIGFFAILIIIGILAIFAPRFLGAIGSRVERKS